MASQFPTPQVRFKLNPLQTTNKAIKTQPFDSQKTPIKSQLFQSNQQIPGQQTQRKKFLTKCQQSMAK
jgi:hypothetical protein